MKFACDSCQTKYTIPDEKVRGKVLKIRCKKCGSVITVKEEVAAPPEPEPPPVEERTRVADIGLLEKLRQAEEMRQAAPAPAPAAAPEPPPVEWFAMVNGEQVGPLSPSDLRAKISSGEVTDRSHVWRDGMSDWLRAGEIDELSGLFAPPPPPPAPAPVARPPSSPRAAPAAAAFSASMASDEDQPTVARQRPDLDQLFGDVHDPAPAAAAPLDSSPIGAEEPGPAVNGANGYAAPSSNLSDLMGDLNTDDHVPTGVKPVVGLGQQDPFAAVPDAPGMAQPQIGEQTRFFMKKAGVTNRNPWWKYAIFVVLVLALPVGVFYALGSMGVGGTVVIVDASGEEKVVAKYSLDNIKSNGLAALLSGQQPQHAPVKKPTTPKKAVANKEPSKNDAVPDPNQPKANLSDADKAKLAQGLQLLDGDPTKSTSGGPKERKDTKTATTDQGAAGLSDEVVAKVVAENTPSFNKCVEDKLKRDPSWKGGKINLTVKIGPSGTVLDSSIAESKFNGSDVGDCIKTRIKRMRFPRFDGDEPQQVEFPLLLANGG